MKTHNTSYPMLIQVAMLAWLLALSLPLSAHEAKLSATPEDGATVQGTPEVIGIAFDGAMRITQFVVSGPDGPVATSEGPGSDPTEEFFVEPAETMAPGHYQVSWRGLARDGHMMSGSFSFTIEE